MVKWNSREEQLRSGVSLILRRARGSLSRQGGGNRKENSWAKERSKGKDRNTKEQDASGELPLPCRTVEHKWEVENGNKCHPSKIKVRSGKASHSIS